MVYPRACRGNQSNARSGPLWYIELIQASSKGWAYLLVVQSSDVGSWSFPLIATLGVYELKPLADAKDKGRCS